MDIGVSIAVAGWFIAFAYACGVSENSAAGVVIIGVVVIVATALYRGVR